MDCSIIIEGLPDDRDLLIPISASYDGKELNITCFEEFAGTAREYAERYGNDPFSREALDFLFRSVDPGMKACGYAMTDDSFEVDWVGTLTELPAPGEYTALNAKDASGLVNRTDIDLDEVAKLHQTAFVCVNGDAVVSVAVENFEEDGSVEIAVETAPEFRRMGYGYSACSALCRDIISDGFTVRWQCPECNAESLALAAKLGFIRTGKDMYMCYYRKDVGEL